MGGDPQATLLSNHGARRFPYAAHIRSPRVRQGENYERADPTSRDIMICSNWLVSRVFRGSPGQRGVGGGAWNA